jgi:predicted RNase H-like HicB family nuclease
LDICEEIETEGLSYHKESFEKAKEQLKEAIKMGVGFA